MLVYDIKLLVVFNKPVSGNPSDYPVLASLP